MNTTLGPLALAIVAVLACAETAGVDIEVVINILRNRGAA